MGMFDSVYIRCRKCGKNIEFQSKSGGCVLNGYSETEVPVSVLKGMEGDINACRGCGTRHAYKNKEEEVVNISNDITVI